MLDFSENKKKLVPHQQRLLAMLVVDMLLKTDNTSPFAE